MLRLSAPQDHKRLREMLSAEGLADKDMSFETKETWVFNDVKGFFSLCEEHEKPYLIHFCIDRESRGHSMARRLVRAFKQVVRGKGHRQAIVNVPVEMNRLNQLVSTYFRAKPYAMMDRHNFYLVEV